MTGAQPAIQSDELTKLYGRVVTVGTATRAARMGRVGRQDVAGRARSLVWWTLGLLALAAINIAFWPTISEQQEEPNRLIESYPEAPIALLAGGGALDLASGAGFLDSRLYAFMFPVVLLIYAIGFGAGAIAGEEDRGPMELLLANPLSRRRLVGLDIGVGRVVAATVALFLLSFALGALARALGSALGKRSVAIGVTAAVALGAYLLQSFGLGARAILGGLVLVFVAAAVESFARRDLRL